jgi:hypothetical protein
VERPEESVMHAAPFEVLDLSAAKSPYKRFSYKHGALEFGVALLGTPPEFPGSSFPGDAVFGSSRL